MDRDDGLSYEHSSFLPDNFNQKHPTTAYFFFKKEIIKILKLLEQNAVPVLKFVAFPDPFLHFFPIS